MAVLVTILALFLLAVTVSRSKKNTPPQRTERQKQVDELITVILPTINSKN